MVDAARHYSYVSVAVADSVAFELYLVGYKCHGVVAHPICSVECGHSHRAVDHSLAHQIDIVQRTHYVQFSVDVGIHVVHERAAEALHKLSSCAVGINAKVYVVVLGRHVSVDVGVASVLILCDGTDIDASFVDIVVHVGVESSHASRLKLEVFHLQVGGKQWLSVERSRYPCLSRGHAEEVNRVEVYEVQHIAHVDVVEGYEQRVFKALCCCSVDGKHLVVVAYGESVNLKSVLAIDDG